MSLKVSVIIPVYKVEKYLRQCLDSVVGQTLKDMEIICVNDGSPDNCGAILAEYAKKDKRIKIVNQENQGLSMARNNGMPHATGEYVTFLDSDDWVALDFYERLYNLAKEHDADIAGGNVLNWHSDSNTCRGPVSTRSYYSKNVVRETLAERRELAFACACWYKIYRRSFIQKHGLGFPAGKLVEDFPFTFMTTALANRIVMDGRAELYYRQRSDSIMVMSKSNRTAFDKIDNHLLIFDLIEESSLENRELYKQLNECFLIEDCFLWLNNTHPDHRQELFDKYKGIVKDIDLKNNYFASAYTQRVAEKVSNAKNMDGVWSNKRHLLGLIRVKRNLSKFKIYLFSFIPIFWRKYKSTNPSKEAAA